ncbi:MAG TPA: uroporphyrinogen-III synthase, partial [Polyangiaceae bacterium]|nr:uroporphyrinogen-III synthase [Polyangiaceae bacterium]
MAQPLTESRPQFGGRAVVALLEAVPSELADLLHAHDAVPIAVPSVSEALYVELEEVRCLIDDLVAKKFEVALFMSGSAVSSLFECAQELGRRAALISALRALTITCRGPKAMAGLRRHGLNAKPEVGALQTTNSLLRTLQDLDLANKGVVRFNGEPNDTLAKSLCAQGANLREISLQLRRSPKDTAAAEVLVRMLVGGAVQALVVSCEIQFLHLYQVARTLDRARELVYALRKRVTVVAVGASSCDVLEAHGVKPHPMPAQPQMLIMALMHFLDTST